MWSGYSEQGRGAQERGPGGFAVNTPGVQSAQAAGAAGEPVRAGIRGGGGNPTGNVVVPERQDETLQTLLRLGQEKLAKQIGKLEEQAFLEGMTRAASGAALDEIQAEQPWYSKIFGDSAVVEGARAYSTQATVEQWAQAVDADMVNLRQVSPGDIPKRLTEGLSPLMTGDAATDTLIRSHALKVLPSLVKRHTKEHAGYLQEQASTARLGAFRSASGLLEQAYKATPGTYTEQDINLRKQSLMETFVPAQGVNLEAWSKDFVGFIEEAAQAGNFHTVATFAESGVFDNLDPDTKVKTTSAVIRWADHHRAKAPGDWHVRSGLIQAQMARREIPATEGIAKLRALNAEFATTTGNPLPLVPETVIGGTTEEAARSLYAFREQEQQRQAKALADAATAEEKSAAEEARKNTLYAAAVAGQLHSTPAKDDEKDQALSAAFTDALAKGDKNGAADIVARQWVNGYKAPSIEDSYRSGFKASMGQPTLTTNFARAYDSWRALNFVIGPKGELVQVRQGGPAASAAMFGADIDSKMQRFHLLTDSGNNVAVLGEEAYKQAMFDRPPEYSATSDKLFRTAVTAKFGGGMFSWFSKGMPEHQKAGAVALVRRYAAGYKDLPPEQAAERAINAALGDGMELVGPGVWKRGPGQRPLEQALSVPASEVGELLSEEFSARLEALKLDEPEHVTWVRQPDVNGDPQLAAVVYSGDKVKTIQINGAALKARYLKTNTPQAPLDMTGAAGAVFTRN